MVGRFGDDDGDGALEVIEAGFATDRKGIGKSKKTGWLNDVQQLGSMSP